MLFRSRSCVQPCSLGTSAASASSRTASVPTAARAQKSAGAAREPARAATSIGTICPRLPTFSVQPMDCRRVITSRPSSSAAKTSPCDARRCQILEKSLINQPVPSPPEIDGSRFSTLENFFEEVISFLIPGTDWEKIWTCSMTFCVAGLVHLMAVLF